MRLTPFQKDIITKMKDGWKLRKDMRMRLPWISKNSPSPGILHSLRWLRRDSVRKLEKAGMITWAIDGERTMIAHLIS